MRTANVDCELDLDEQEETVRAHIKRLNELSKGQSVRLMGGMLDAWRRKFRSFIDTYFPEFKEDLFAIETNERPSISPFIQMILNPLLEEIESARDALPRERQLTRSQWEDLYRLKKKMDPGGHVIGKSAPTLRLFQRIKELNQNPKDPILLLGPTGSGKTHIAKLIHASRHPNDERLENFHRESATVSATTDFGFVLERLLGHGKNSSLHGASRNAKQGILETHKGGTLFVDEITEATALLQTLLFDILDHLPIESPFGDAIPFAADISVIFATNYDLDSAMKQGLLKRDFVARIGKRIVRIAPLRRRRLDIFGFVREYCPEILDRSKSTRVETRDRMRRSRFLVALLRHSWPSNTRELIEVLKAANAAQAVSGTAHLTHEHLDVGSRRAVDEVSLMADGEVTRYLLNTCERLLGEVGFGLQTGGATNLAELLGWPQSTLAKVRRALGAEETGSR